MKDDNVTEGSKHFVLADGLTDLDSLVIVTVVKKIVFVTQ